MGPLSPLSLHLYHFHSTHMRKQSVTAQVSSSIFYFHKWVFSFMTFSSMQCFKSSQTSNWNIREVKPISLNPLVLARILQDTQYFFPQLQWPVTTMRGGSVLLHLNTLPFTCNPSLFSPFPSQSNHDPPEMGASILQVLPHPLCLRKAYGLGHDDGLWLPF